MRDVIKRSYTNRQSKWQHRVSKSCIIHDLL